MRSLTMTLLAMAGIAGTPRPAAAQASDEWQFSLVPMYFWATELDGQISAGTASVPIFLEFSDAKDNLGGAFSIHFEASKGRWGVLTDLNFIRLSSTSPFTVTGRSIEGDFDLDNVMFELGGSFLINPNARLAVIGGCERTRCRRRLRSREPPKAQLRSTLARRRRTPLRVWYFARESPTRGPSSDASMWGR